MLEVQRHEQPGLNEEADKVLAALRECRSIDAINAVAKGTDIDKIRAGADGGTRVIHVKNLAALMRKDIRGAFK